MLAAQAAAASAAGTRVGPSATASARGTAGWEMTDATTVRRYAAAGRSSRFLLRISGGRIPRRRRLLELHVRLDPEQERLRQCQAEDQGAHQERVAHLRMLKGVPPQKITENDQRDDDPVSVEVHAVAPAKVAFVVAPRSAGAERG